MPNRNGKIHEGIIDDLRFNLPSFLHNHYENYACVSDEGLMSGLIHSGNQKSIRPDLYIEYGELPVFVEVGTLNTNKWNGCKNPIIHISHNKSVGLINGNITEKLQMLLSEIRRILKTY